MDVDRASAEMWAGWFRALGDGSRVLILNRLATGGGPLTVGEIVAAVDVGQSTVSHHLKILAETGFVLVETAGQLQPLPGQRALPGGLPLRGRGGHGAAAALRPSTRRLRGAVAVRHRHTRHTDEEHDMTSDDALVDGLKAHYGAAARQAARGTAPTEDAPPMTSCACGPGTDDVFGAALYRPTSRSHSAQASAEASVRQPFGAARWHRARTARPGLGRGLAAAGRRRVGPPAGLRLDNPGDARPGPSQQPAPGDQRRVPGG